MKKTGFAIIGSVCILTQLLGCGSTKDKYGLDPDKPTEISIWHYYNGAQQIAFDDLVKEFNSTVGKEKGIYVTAHSQGSVTQLEENARSAMRGDADAQEVPNVFSSYADTAYEFEKMGKLADLSDYISDEEFQEYMDSYIEEGKIGLKGELRIFPTAKSSEIMMVNKTDWEKFAQDTGASLEELKTLEGVAKVSQEYYEWTDGLTPDIPNDGKAFYGRDSDANLFVIASMQFGHEIFQVSEGKGTLNLDETVMRKIWDSYYVPFVKGYYGAYGKFRSDDMKIGELLAYTGSTSSAMYFPDIVEISDNDSYPVDYAVLPAPILEGGENYRVQQGAGMAVTKTTEKEEYASVTFLKWFTEAENNLRFVCASGYLPVKKEAMDWKLIDKVVEEDALEVSPKTRDTLTMFIDDQEDGKFYTNKAFDGGSDARKVLDNNLTELAKADREKVKQGLEQGKTLEEASEPYINDTAFENWYDSLKEQLLQAMEG